MRTLSRKKAVVLVLLVLYGIAMAGDPAAANRDAVGICLLNLALQAQEYYRKPARLGGGEGDFANLTISRLVVNPYRSVGSFVLTSPTASSVTLTGTGVETGNDESTPVEIEVIVYADSMTVTVTN
jgi:hypothetical protein